MLRLTSVSSVEPSQTRRIRRASGKIVIERSLDLIGPVQFGAMLTGCDATLSFMRREEHEERAGAYAFVLIIDTFRRAVMCCAIVFDRRRFHRQRSYTCMSNFTDDSSIDNRACYELLSRHENHLEFLRDSSLDFLL